MGWKVNMRDRHPEFEVPVAIRFRWIWVEKRIKRYNSIKSWSVAIRFRWIWVEKWTKFPQGVNKVPSQSAFAGYGLKSKAVWPLQYANNIVAIRFRWIWVEKQFRSHQCPYSVLSRNPLSLDMGWKADNLGLKSAYFKVAIRFRWIWVEKRKVHLPDRSILCVAIRFRWIWVEKSPKTAPWGYHVSSRNPLSLDMGWKAARKFTVIQLEQSQSAFAGYGLKSDKYDTWRES